MECADALLDPAQLEDWWNWGLRLIGPAHSAEGRYAGGTGSASGLTDLGPPLLAEMQRLGIPLDLTHCSDAAFWECLQHYEGPVLASHSNSRSLVPHQRELDDAQIQAILDRHTDAWGIKVSNVEIKHVDLDESMIRAIARQAEAERSRRAKVIHAEGEQQAAEKLTEAARALALEPQAMQLRYLQTLLDVTTGSSGQNSTIIFPLPMDLIKPLMAKLEADKG